MTQHSANFFLKIHIFKSTKHVKLAQNSIKIVTLS